MAKPWKLTSFAAVEGALQELERSPSPRLTGGWTVPQMLAHCAQSIDYSVQGYPTDRSALFRRTIGPLALKRFLSKGEMSHDLQAAIPGAPPLPDGTLQEGIARLRDAMARFQAHPGQLAHHFAYGPVTREHYEKVHAMHVANHLSAVEL
ncbi:MAG TPA: DUF1569 domain-containing protein [Myxococcaceae bacterium]|nr:DUF1569 domain-containing protein [Myxococcaceae bacterium]